MSSDYTARSRLFHDALDAAFDRSPGAGDDPATLAALAGLIEQCRAAAGEDPIAAGALDAFEAIAARRDTDGAVSEAASLFVSPQRFREALFFLRCLGRDAAGALSLMRHRTYLSAAVAPVEAHPDLAANQAALLDRTTFEALWRSPDARPEMEDAIQEWRRGYVPVYTREHAAYNQHVAGVVSDVEAAQWQIGLIEKLNWLDRLGEPVALAALAQFQTLETAFVCNADAVQLAAELAETPVCPYCDYRLGDVPPVETLNAALIAIERGLDTQRGRLALRVVARLLAAPGRAQESRLDRFISVVQASDMPGLAAVLDEGLLEFLGDVLATPEPRVDLVDRLASDFPEVTQDSLEAVVAAFRTLIEGELERRGGRLLIGREDAE